MLIKLSRIVLLLLIGLLFVSSGPSHAAESDSKTDDEIREAVARYQIQKWDLAGGVYFLEINSLDPSDAFLQRFSTLAKPVKKKSAARIKRTAKVIELIEDKRTHERGVIFDQEAIIRWDDTSVDVEGGYRCGSLCSGSGTYHLFLKDGKWIVSGFEVSFIS